MIHPDYGRDVLQMHSVRLPRSPLRDGSLDVAGLERYLSAAAAAAELEKSSASAQKQLLECQRKTEGLQAERFRSFTSAARALPCRGWADGNLVVGHAHRRAVIREVMAQRLAAER